MIKFRKLVGTYEETMAEVKIFDDKKRFYEFLQKEVESIFLQEGFKVNRVSCSYYCNDLRNKWNTHIVYYKEIPIGFTDGDIYSLPDDLSTCGEVHLNPSSLKLNQLMRAAKEEDCFSDYSFIIPEEYEGVSDIKFFGDFTEDSNFFKRVVEELKNSKVKGKIIAEFNLGNGGRTKLPFSIK